MTTPVLLEPLSKLWFSGRFFSWMEVLEDTRGSFLVMSPTELWFIQLSVWKSWQPNQNQTQSKLTRCKCCLTLEAPSWEQSLASCFIKNTLQAMKLAKLVLMPILKRFSSNLALNCHNYLDVITFFCHLNTKTTSKWHIRAFIKDH